MSASNFLGTLSVFDRTPFGVGDFAEAAAHSGVETNVLRAVAEVEAQAPEGFVAGRPLVTFEPVVFARLTNHRFDVTHPKVSQNRWGSDVFAMSGELVWDALEEAYGLDPKAALAASAWGVFRIMGFNYELCGFNTEEDFIRVMARSNRDQLFAFTEYIKGRGLDDELRAKNFAGFAQGFNGAGFAMGDYAARIKGRLDQLEAGRSKGSRPCPIIRRRICPLAVRLCSTPAKRQSRDPPQSSWAAT